MEPAKPTDKQPRIAPGTTVFGAEANLDIVHAMNHRSGISNPRADHKTLDLGHFVAKEPVKPTQQQPRIAAGVTDLGVEANLGTVHTKNTKSGISNPGAELAQQAQLSHFKAMEPAKTTQQQPRIVLGVTELGAEVNLGTVHSEISNPRAELAQQAKLMSKEVINKLRDEIKAGFRGPQWRTRSRGRSRVTMKRRNDEEQPNAELQGVDGLCSQPRDANRVFIRSGRSFASMVNSNPLDKKLKLSFVEPVVDGETEFFEPTDEVILEASAKWKDYLVGYFISGSMSLLNVQRAAKGYWGKLGLGEVLADASGLFFFQFSDENMRMKILEEGPWLFFGRNIILQQWTPDLVLCKRNHDRIPLWVRIHKMPLSLWTVAGLSGIFSLINKPLYVDSFTESMSKIAFARVCVEVSAHKPLPDSVNVRLAGTVLNLKVDYQWKPETCQKCNPFGHTCKEKESIPPQVDKGKAIIQDAQSDSEGYTLVQRKQNSNAGIIILEGNSQTQMDRAVALATAPANKPLLALIQEPSKESTVSNGEEDDSYEVDVSNPAQLIQDAKLINAESEEVESESEESHGFEGNGVSSEQNTQLQRNDHLVSQKTTEIILETQITPSQGDVQLDSSFDQVIAALSCEQLAKLSATKPNKKSKEDKQKNEAAQSSSRRRRR